jgi:hypothetical protein
MTSKRKAASNRINGRRSSGPTTAAGKIHSSRNARKHGLAVPITNDQTWLQKIESLALEIAGDDADHWRLEEARILAEATLDIVRVRAARTRLLDLTGIVRLCQRGPKPRKPRSAAPLPETSPDDRRNLVTAEEFEPALKQITLFDRYERRALARRNRAVRRLV